MLDKLTVKDFEKRIGETFQASPDEGEPFELELRRAELSPFHDDDNGKGEKGKPKGRAPFSIEFHSRLPHHTPQQTFSLKHDDLGTFDLFLVPLGPDAEGHRYEAIFS